MRTKKGLLLFFLVGLAVNILLPKLAAGTWNFALALGWTVGVFFVWLMVKDKLR